ncbi:GGDEF domain-containing protein [Mesorhizobium sp.]|uniref:GGDEF domain-containing protein n=1 Tax=Mesorhizobium sp. TaxID=1871066 RepID=UPI003BA934AC
MHRNAIETPPPLATDDSAEAGRLAALDRLDILDTPREESFDRITRIIRNVFELPVALVSMIDGHRQWYKACDGLGDGTEIDRAGSFCKYTVREMTPLIVPDASLDARFSVHPHVIGEPHVRFYAGVPLRTGDGNNIGTVCAIGFEPRQFSARDTEILSDLAQLAMDALELRQQASFDMLTAALSRRAFKEQAGKAVALAQRHKHHLGCIAFDLDHFKSVNDSHGHAAGDKVLAAVAKACRGELRGTDLFGRLGGEEFAILVPHTDPGSVINVAEKLRAAIARIVVDAGNAQVRITASFGIAALDARTPDIDTLLANADAALYQAKGAGRDRCMAWHNAASERSVRRRVLKAGRILFNDRRSSIDCTVRSLAGDSAGLDVTTSIGVPETFNLAIRADGFETRCRIRLRTERHIEVEFC